MSAIKGGMRSHPERSECTILTINLKLFFCTAKDDNLNWKYRVWLGLTASAYSHGDFNLKLPHSKISIQG